MAKNVKRFREIKQLYANVTSKTNKMNSLENSRSDSAIATSGHKKLSYSSNKGMQKKEQLVSIYRPSFYRKNATSRNIKLVTPSIFIAAVFIFISDVFITKCTSQIDLGEYFCVSVVIYCRHVVTYYSTLKYQKNYTIDI